MTYLRSIACIARSDADENENMSQYNRALKIYALVGCIAYSRNGRKSRGENSNSGGREYIKHLRWRSLVHVALLVSDREEDWNTRGVSTILRESSKQ